MYTSIEKAPSYVSQLPDITKAKKKDIVGKVRQLLTAALGREFMEAVRPVTRFTGSISASR